MTFLLDCTIQISAVFLIALSSLRLLRRKSAAVRHWILSVAICFAAITPVLHLVMPSWDLGLLITERSIGAPLQERISAITPPETGTQIERAMSPAKPSIVKWRPEESLIARWRAGVIWLIGAAVELIV